MSNREQESIHPSILGGLDYETKYIQSRSRGDSRRVKLNRGDTWVLRFLPAQLGPEKRFYVRIARHWIGKEVRPVICPVETEAAMGGRDDGYCPVCEMAKQLNDNRDEEISNFGWKLKAQPQWFTYCAVFEKSTRDGTVSMPMSEILVPYEFNHYSSTFEELKAWVRGHQRVCDLSVFDYIKGCDFMVTRTGKGTRLDKQEAGPIFDPKNPKFDTWIEKLEKQLKTPPCKIPKEDALEDFADKANESITRRRDGPRRRHRYDDDDDGRGARSGSRHDDDGDDRRSGRGYAASEDEEDRLERPAARSREDDTESRRPADGENRQRPRERADGDEPARRPRESDRGEEQPARRHREAEEQPARRSERSEESQEAPRRPRASDGEQSSGRRRDDGDGERPVRRQTEQPARRQAERDRGEDEAGDGRSTLHEPRRPRAEKDDVPMDYPPGTEDDPGAAAAEAEQPTDLPETTRSGRKPSTAARRPFEESVPRGSRTAPKSDRINDDPEEMAEERRDPAPPEEERGRPGPEPDAPKRSLGSQIRSRVEALSSREKQ